MARDLRVDNSKYKVRYHLYDKEIINGRLVKKEEKLAVFYAKQIGDKITAKNPLMNARFQDVNFFIETPDLIDFKEDQFVEDPRTKSLFRIATITTIENVNSNVEQCTLKPILIKRLGLSS